MLKPLTFGAVTRYRFVQTDGPSPEELGVVQGTVESILMNKLRRQNPDSTYLWGSQPDTGDDRMYYTVVDGKDYEALKPLANPREVRKAQRSLSKALSQEYIDWVLANEPPVEAGTPLAQTIEAHKKAMDAFNKATGPFGAALRKVVEEARKAGTLVEKEIRYRIDPQARRLKKTKTTIKPEGTYSQPGTLHQAASTRPNRAFNRSQHLFVIENG